MKRKFDNITPPKEKEDESEEDRFFYSIKIKNFPNLTKKNKIRDRLKPLEKELGEYTYSNFRKAFRRNRPMKGLYLRFASEEIRNKARPIIEKFNPSWELQMERGIKRRKVVGRDVERVHLPIEFVVTPLHELPYDQQLKQKDEEAKDIYKKMSRRIIREIKYPRGTPRPKKKELLGTFLPIVGSPVLNYYRNKCEFTCGYYEEGKPGVGFLFGNFRDGYTRVADPSNLLHVSKNTNDIRKRFEELVQENSSEKFRVYTKANHSGFWRTLMIRENVNSECLVVVQVNEKEMGDKSIEELGKLLVSKLVPQQQTDDDESGPPKYIIRGIFIQQHGGISNAAAENSPIDCVYGQNFFIETVLGRKFKISPNSFFQVNTKGAETLYSIVRDWLLEVKNVEYQSQSKEREEEEEEEEEEGENENDDDNKSQEKKKENRICLLDVCCGTGTIGQILCDYVDHVVGIDISESCINDAKENQKLNGIPPEKLEYVCGPAEKTIKNVILKKRDKYEKFVAIVDPPRNGLHKKVLKELRVCQGLDDIIFVSCKMKTMSANCVQLCKTATNQYVGGRFTPVKYVSVDMFPHCGHFESVMYLKRVQMEQRKKKKVLVEKKSTEKVDNQQVMIPPPPPPQD